MQEQSFTRNGVIVITIRRNERYYTKTFLKQAFQPKMNERSPMILQFHLKVDNQ